jgi:hypothetical protein
LSKAQSSGKFRELHKRLLVASLPPMYVILVVHLALRRSPQISLKIEMILMLFSGDWGKMIHKKNLKPNIS